MSLPRADDSADPVLLFTNQSHHQEERTLPHQTGFYSESSMPQMLQALCCFFHDLFVDPGPQLLPGCLKYVIRELYMMLRQVSPEEPEKIHLKFIGQFLVHGFFKYYLIAPETLINHRRGQTSEWEMDHGQLSPHSSADKGSTTQQCPLTITSKQRQTLAAVSRLLYLVITNKGYGEEQRKKNLTNPCENQCRFSELFNPHIKHWHGQYRVYVQNIVQSPRSELFEQMDGNIISTWIKDAGLFQSVENGEVGSRADEMAGIVLKTAELFELQRLLMRNVDAVAPHPADPMRHVLQNLPDLPSTTNARKCSSLSESTQRGLRKNFSENTDRDIPWPTAATGLRGIPLPTVDTTCDNHNRGDTSEESTSFLLNMNQVYQQPITRASKSRGRRMHRIHGTQTIFIRLEPTNQLQALFGQIYGAMAAFSNSTNCTPLPFRMCHWSDRDTNCKKCQAELVPRTYHLWTSVLSDITEARGEDSLKSSGGHYSSFDWLEARRALALILRKISYIENLNPSNRPPVPHKYSTLSSWMKQIERWLVKERLRLSSSKNSSRKNSNNMNEQDSSDQKGEEYAIHLGDMKVSMDSLRSALDRLVSHGFVKMENGYNELVVGLARDVCHLRSDCNMSQLNQLVVVLNRVLDDIKVELQTMDEQANVYATHALECLVPLTVDLPRVNRSSSKHHSINPYELTLSSTRLRKSGLLKLTQHKNLKWLNTLQLHLEPIRPENRGDFDPITEVAVPQPQFVPGMFDLRLEAPGGMTVYRDTISLVDLLCRHQQGETRITLLDDMDFELDMFIQLILDTYYIAH